MYLLPLLFQGGGRNFFPIEFLAPPLKLGVFQSTYVFCGCKNFTSEMYMYMYTNVFVEQMHISKPPQHYSGHFGAKHTLKSQLISHTDL